MEEKKKIKIGTIIKLGLLALGLIWGLGYTIQQCRHPTIKEIIVKEPTIVNMPVPYELKPQPNSKPVVPNTIIYYADEPAKPIDSIRNTHDTIRIYLPDSTKVEYNSRFLTRFTNAPKLVMGQFTSDSITLDLLEPNGTMNTKIYQVYYQKYKYDYWNDTLHKLPLTTKPKSGVIVERRPFYKESNLYLTVDPFTTKPQISGDYSLMYKNFGVVMKGDYALGSKPFLGVGIRIKLN